MWSVAGRQTWEKIWSFSGSFSFYFLLSTRHVLSNRAVGTAGCSAVRCTKYWMDPLHRNPTDRSDKWINSTVICIISCSRLLPCLFMPYWVIQTVAFLSETVDSHISISTFGKHHCWFLLLLSYSSQPISTSLQPYDLPSFSPEYITAFQLAAA